MKTYAGKINNSGSQKVKGLFPSGDGGKGVSVQKSNGKDLRSGPSGSGNKMKGGKK